LLEAHGQRGKPSARQGPPHDELALITSPPPIEKRVEAGGSEWESKGGLWIKIDFSYGGNNRAVNAVRRRQPLIAVIV